VTFTALQLVQDHYSEARSQGPFQPCTGVYTKTWGLPCAHKVQDIISQGISLLPGDFHSHWYWDRTSSLLEPILEPLRTITYGRQTTSQVTSQATSQITTYLTTTSQTTTSLTATCTSQTTRRTKGSRSTRRLPSSFEASEPPVRRCSQCRLPGHTRGSIRCPANISRLNQELSAQISTNPDPALYISRSTIQGIVNSATSGQSALKSALQTLLAESIDQHILKSTVQSILNSTAQPGPELPSQPDHQPASQPVSQPGPELPSQPDTRPIWPGRIELIYQRYLTDKEAWLTANPYIRPANYRTIRGLKDYSSRWIKEQRRYLPQYRLDLQTETLLVEEPPKWSDEEVISWIDYQAILDEEAEQRAEARLVARGGFGRDTARGMRGIQSAFESDEQAERDKYRFYG
jgi:hypothetical protein